MIDFLQNTNPLIFLLFLIFLYSFLYLLRSDIKKSLLFLGTAFLFILLLSPGGQAIADKTKYLSSPEKRGACLVRSLASGGLWQTEASEGSYCRE